MKINYKSKIFTVYKGKPCLKNLTLHYLPMQDQLGHSHPINHVPVLNLMNRNWSIGTTLLLKNAVQVLVLRLIYNVKENERPVAKALK